MDSVERYFEAWNAQDPAARLKAVEAAFAADARYLAPETETRGRQGVAEMIGAAHARIGAAAASFRFEPAGPPDHHHGRVRMPWALKGPDGAAVMTGVSFAELDDEGRLALVVGFYDTAAPAS